MKCKWFFSVEQTFKEHDHQKSRQGSRAPAFEQKDYFHYAVAQSLFALHSACTSKVNFFYRFFFLLKQKELQSFRSVEK